MAGEQILKAKKRTVLGRKVKTLRKQGILPSNIYGKNVKSLAVEVSIDEFKKVFEKEGETGLVSLKVNGDVRPVLIHNVQKDPILQTPIHADFLQVNLKEKVTATVPIEFVGESPVEKSKEGIVVEQLNEVEVEALPADLPEKIVVDISKLVAVDDAVYVSQLILDKKKVEIKEDPKRIIVSVAPPAEEEEAAPPTEEVAAEAEKPEGEEVAGESQATTPQKQGQTEADKDKQPQN